MCTYKSILICYNYDINNNEFSPGQKTLENGCENYQSALILDYFYETNKFVAGCLGNNGEFYISTFNEQLSWDESSAKISSVGQNIGKVGIINIILPSGQTKYNAFTSPIQGCDIVTCDSIQAQFDLDITIVNTYPTGESSDLVCSFPDYYNYEKTNCITEISEGYYCNSTEKRTIDKCHNNCKSCQQGGDDNSNNCLTCKDGLYYNLGNCVERSLCTNDVFTDGSINKCKCIQQSKCLLCDSTSLSYSKCLSCNTDSHYYPKQEDINNHNTYIECYNSESIGNGFILNSENHYAQCYENWLNCYGVGDSYNNKCTECKSNYSKIKNNYNIENCYPNCQYYFYFNNANEYICLNSNNCPENYKLIDGKNKCIINCANDEIYNYKVEYKNVCYNTCPQYTKIVDSNSNICKLKCEDYDGKYYNYD